MCNETNKEVPETPDQPGSQGEWEQLELDLEES